ncbi:MAG: hypothetical protein RKH07_06995 [Gammaproteobacteria bacterium]
MAERKYYTPAEAAQVANTSESEITHYIETDQLPACLLSGRRQYIVTTRADNGDLIALGSATFAGLLSVHSSWIKSLLEHEEIVLDKLAQPIYTNDLQGYSPESPFSSELLPELIKAWQPTNWEKANSIPYRLIPLPVEKPNSWHTLNNALKLMQKAQGTDSKSLSAEHDIPPIKFDFNLNGKFNLIDLRITTGDLNKLIHPNSPEYTENQSANKELGEIKLNWCDSRKRNSQLDPVIERLFILNSENSAPELWELLMSDIDEDEPQYDLKGVVTGMDVDSLDWETTQSGSKSLTRKTFFNKISEIREFYKNSNSQNIS